MDGDGLLGRRSLRKPTGRVSVVAAAVDEHRGAHVPGRALGCRTRAGIGVGAGVIDQNAGRLVRGAALSVARAEIAVVARGIVEDAQAWKYPVP